MKFYRTAMTLILALGITLPAHAVTLDATARGPYYDSLAAGNAADNFYYAGFAPGNPSLHGRNWFAFDLSSVSGTVTDAVLRVSVGGVRLDTGDTPGQYQLHEVTTAVSDLGVTDGIGIFDDLADGPVYGQFTYDYSDANQVIDIVLTTDALTAINASAGGAFAMGGQVSNIDFNDPWQQEVFGFTGSSASVSQLILTLEGQAVPEPATSLLGVLGLGVLLVSRRGRCREDRHSHDDIDRTQQ